jgi:flavin reductase (DIM6/NTAB) family NADH-FMN oxidoreductase RutF
MPVDADIFRNVLAQFASGVTIVTVQVEGQRHGLTVSSFTSVSLDPPLVLACIDKKLHSHRLIEKSGAFAVNILSRRQLDWGLRFAGLIPEIDDRFAGIDFKTAITGSPILPGCLAWADCKVYDIYDGGDHTIFVGEVVAGDAPVNREASGGVPLLYYNRAWRQLANGKLEP